MNDYLKFKTICNELDHFPLDSELIYKYGFKHQDLKEFSKQKFEDAEFCKLKLMDQFGNQLFYWNNEKVITNFSGSQDLIRNSILNQSAELQNKEVLNSFVLTEIEANLSIEGVRTTKAIIEKLNRTDYDNLAEPNDISVKNMLLGYEFVKNNDITEENIFKLYNILSKNCLKEEEVLLPGAYYRHDGVNIMSSANTIVDKGVEHQALPKLMKELINYINSEKTYEEHLLASHIIHFYIIFLHPYFDYNGRMARVMSFWYNYKHAPALSLLLVSEAINNKVHKAGYYNAIQNTRSAGNDLTYFLEYMGNIILKYAKIYINFYNIVNKLKGDGNLINRATEVALKYVLALPGSGEGYFNWKDYKDSTHEEFSKQYCLRLLNELADLEILTVKEYKKAKLYRLNTDKLDLFK